MADPVAYAQAQIDDWHKRLKVGGIDNEPFTRPRANASRQRDRHDDHKCEALHTSPLGKGLDWLLSTDEY